MSTRADKLAYFVALGLFVCVALIIVDLGIKNDLIKQARKLQEAINGAQGQSVYSDDNRGDSVRGDVLGGIQATDGTVADGSVSQESAEIPLPSAGVARRSTRNSNPPIPE